VVIFDQRPSRYTEESFEQAVDVAASVLVACAADKAPVELRLTDGTVIGGPRMRAVTPLIDHLTGVQPKASGSLQAQLMPLRRARGGTTLVVITGEIERADLPYVAALRRRFDRLVVLSIDPERHAPIDFPGVRVIVGRDADELRAGWNLQGHG
jgi:uncharacterized protein (DUF58 family)